MYIVCSFLFYTYFYSFVREFSFAPADETREKAPRRRRKRCDGVFFFSRLKRPFLLSARSLTPRVSWPSNDSLFLFIPVYLPLARTFIIIK